MVAKGKAKKRGKSAAKMMAAAKKQVEKDKLAKPQRPQVLATPEQARARTDNIKEKYRTMGRMWWALGEEVKKSVEDRVPEALGMSFTEWMTDCFGDGWQTMRRAFVSVKALAGVETTKLEKISEGNAYVLARLPEKERKSSEWVKKAADLPNEKFKEAAEKLITKKTGIKDPLKSITDAFGFTKVPKSFVEIVKETMSVAAGVLNADVDSIKGRIDCVEAIFVEYLQHHQQAPAEEETAEVEEV